MAILVRLTWIAVLVAALAIGPATADQPRAGTEVAKLGKAATALVEVKPRYGSAFCVHASGLFVTNEHVIRGATDKTITLVLNPGTKKQQKLQARVVRSDEGLDLALLRVDRAGQFPVVPLGTAEDLSELAEVVAFGFPFGTVLAEQPGTYPAISVNVGRITSLRRNPNGDLHRIQVDNSLNPGNSGGPMLDQSGKVVGVVVAGIHGSGVNFGIPVEEVARFLAKPELQFTPPTLTAANVHSPVTFQVTAATLTPGAAPLDVELILRNADNERKFAMKLQGTTHRATVIPVPTAEAPSLLRLQAGFGNDSIVGRVEDGRLRVGGRALRISEVREIRFQPTPEVVLTDGKTLGGQVSGLTPLAIHLGSEIVQLDMAKANEIKIEPASPVDSVGVTIVASQGGKEVGRISNTIDVGENVVASAPALAIVPARLSGDRNKVLSLPGPIGDIVVGGAGRYLIMHLPTMGKLAVFDASVARIVRYLPMAGENVKIAAGLDKLVVVLPNDQVIQRWSLTTFEREATAPVPVAGVVKAIAMGSASKGPLLVYWAMGTQALDRCKYNLVSLQTLKTTSTEIQPHGMMGFSFRDNMHLRASATGQAFGTWSTSGSPQGLGAIVLVGSEAKVFYDHTSPSYVVPGPDGNVFYTGIGRYTNQLKSMENQQGKPSVLLPASQGPYYLSIQQPDENPRRFPTPGSKATERKATLDYYLAGDSRSFHKMTDVAIVEEGPWINHDLTLDKRIQFLPAFKLLVTIPLTNDKLELHPLDLDQALARSSVDYLFVTSQPPHVAYRGSNFSYQLAVMSRKKGLTYSVDSGPPGMAVSSTGKVTWKVPSETEEEITVIVSIHDSTGQECFHTFKLNVRE